MTVQAEYPAVDAFVRWARKQYASGEQTADQLVKRAMAQYAQSPLLLEAFVREALTFFALEVTTGKRPGIVNASLAQADPMPVSDSSEGGDRAQRFSAKRRQHILKMVMYGDLDDPITKFFEKHPGVGVVVPILKMTREELLEAAVARDVESAEARKRAALCRAVAERLQPGQVAEEVVTETDLEKMEQRIVKQSAPRPLRSAS